MEVGKKVNCTVIHVDRKGYESQAVLDHSPWGEGILPFADIALAQNADIFIGSRLSTFSHLIANIVSYQALRKNFQQSSLYWFGWLNGWSSVPLYHNVEEGNIGTVPKCKSE